MHVVAPDGGRRETSDRRPEGAEHSTEGGSSQRIVGQGAARRDPPQGWDAACLKGGLLDRRSIRQLGVAAVATAALS